MKKVLLVIMMICVCRAVAVAGNKDKETMLNNGSFEEPKLEGTAKNMLNPDDWNVYANKGVFEKIGISKEHKKSGNQSMLMSSIGQDNVIQGIWVPADVTERERYVLELYVKNDPQSPMKDNHRGQVSIEWKDAEGIEVARDMGPEWNRSLSKQSWKRKRMIVSAPNGAKQARIVITYDDGLNSEEGGTFYVDDVVFREK